MNYIFGYGAFGKAVAKVMRKKGLPYFFLDNYYEGKEVTEGLVLRPKEQLITQDDVIFLTAYALPVNHESENLTLKICEGLGAGKVYELCEISDFFPEVWEYFVSDGYMWRKANESTLWDSSRTDPLRDYFIDKTSLEVFDKIGRFRNEPKFTNYPWPQVGPQYFTVCGIESRLYGKSNVGLIDVGAYVGDTLLDAHKKFGKNLTRYVGFEPMEKNIIKLNQSIQEVEQVNPAFEAIVHKKATGSKKSTTSFSYAGSSSTQTKNIDEDHEVVEVIRLDDVDECRGMSLFKMDIEGAEMETLEGAVELLRDSKPACAIACYHRADDIWRIPEFFIERFPSARFALRQHSHYGMELVLYVTLS